MLYEVVVFIQGCNHLVHILRACLHEARPQEPDPLPLQLIKHALPLVQTPQVLIEALYDAINVVLLSLAHIQSLCNVRLQTLLSLIYFVVVLLAIILIASATLLLHLLLFALDVG